MSLGTVNSHTSIMIGMLNVGESCGFDLSFHLYLSIALFRFNLGYVVLWLHGREEQYFLNANVISKHHDRPVDTYINYFLPSPHPPVGGSACSNAFTNTSS